MRRLRYALVLCLLPGCVMTFERPEEPWARIDSPPAHWAAEYAWTWTHCGATMRRTPVMPFEALTFFQVEAADWFHVQGVEATGFWQWNEIWLLDDAVMQVLPVVRSHEYLHAQIGAPGHPPIFEACYRLLLATPLPEILTP